MFQGSMHPSPKGGGAPALLSFWESLFNTLKGNHTATKFCMVAKLDPGEVYSGSTHHEHDKICL